MAGDPLIKIGAKPSLSYGSSAQPNHRAPYARQVVLFTSGKGGVGKSTVAVNTAIAWAQMGLSVGLLDADVYGPSVPRLMDLREERLVWNDQNQIVPAENYGVKVMSTGMTTPEADTPLAWRSSVATSALVQLLEDVAWGDLDILAVDLPPGTGDVQITMVQELKVSAAVLVTTPQPVATDDVRRAIRMLLDVKIPIAGVVENYSYLALPDGQKLYPFGEGGGQILAEHYQLPLLAQLPLLDEIRVGSDTGRPSAVFGGESKKYWAALADKVYAPLVK